MEDNKELITRIAVCVVIALIVYYAGDKIFGKMHMELWDKYKPWLEENKLQAIAILTAVLFGVSLAAFPLSKEEKEEEEPDY